jgi:hypothetical protein
LARYTKHPATWLNAECWLDEPPVDAGGLIIDQDGNPIATAEQPPRGAFVATDDPRWEPLAARYRQEHRVGPPEYTSEASGKRGVAVPAGLARQSAAVNETPVSVRNGRVVGGRAMTTTLSWTDRVATEPKIRPALYGIAVLLVMARSPRLLSFENAFHHEQPEALSSGNFVHSGRFRPYRLERRLLPIAARHPRRGVHSAVIEHLMYLRFDRRNLGRGHPGLPQTEVALERHARYRRAAVVKI